MSLSAQTLADLARLRRQTMATLSTLERLLRDAHPVCKKCFFDQGLLDACRCGGIRLTIQT